MTPRGRGAPHLTTIPDIPDALPPGPQDATALECPLQADGPEDLCHHLRRWRRGTGASCKSSPHPDVQLSRLERFSGSLLNSQKDGQEPTV